jgi:uncharacterized protein (DUF2147 family)
MKNLKITLVLLCITLFTQAQNKKIIGVWWNQEKTSRVEVYEENSKIFGKIVWLEDNKNKDGSSPRTDYNNPKIELQKNKLIGTRILKNLRWDADDTEWTKGEIYDPKTGKTYSCYAVLQNDGKLYLKGYVLGMPFIGKSTLWTRYQ